MRFGVLGPLQVLDGDTDVTPSGRLQRTLLAHLLAHVNRPVTPGVLAEAAWPGEPEGGPGRLQVHLHRLRKVLDDPDRLSHGPDGYVLRADADEFDATRFESLRSRALAPGLDHTQMLPLAAAAQELWRGAAYEGLDGDAVHAEAWRLTELDLELLEVRYTVELGHHNHAAVLSDLAALAARHPLRERLQGLLMTGLYRAGRQADALEHYRRTHRALADELGVEPGPELRGVHALVLSGEAAAPTTVRQRPNQLLPAVAGFVGRRADLAVLERAVRSGAGAALIAGPAGAGKTSLALQWAHEHLEEYPDGRLYADLSGFSARPPLTASGVIASWLLALGVNSDLIPSDLDGRSAVLRSLTAERRLLLVADNAGEPDQVRPLLPGGGTSVLLVTSRHALPGLVGRDGVPRVDLGGLTEADAVALLAAHTQDQEFLPALAKRCGYLPLTLRLLVERIGTGTQPTADLLAELDDHRTRLDLLDAAGDPDAGIRSVLSWSYENLTEPDRSLLQYLGVFPGTSLETADLAALADIDLAAARRGMDTLVRMHLVEPTETGAFTQHDVLAAYTRELAEHGLGTVQRQDALARLVRHLTTTAFLAHDTWDPPRAPHRAEYTDGVRSPFESASLAANWPEQRRTDLVQVAFAARAAGVGGLIPLAQATIPLLYAQGYLDECADLLTQSVESEAEDAEDVPAMEVSLAAVLSNLGERDGAIRRTEKARESLRAAGNRERESVAVFNLGCYQYELGHRTRAEELFREALALFVESGHTLNRSRALCELGATIIGLGRIAEGQRLMQEALVIARAERDDDERAMILDRLASYAVEWLDLTAARRYADELSTLVRERQLRRSEPAALCWQGLLAGEDNDLDRAEALVDEGLRLAHQIRETGLVPRMINVRGMVDARRGDHGTALARHQEALALAARARALPEHADGHRHLGRTYEALGDLRAAARHYARAVQQYAAYERVGRYPDLAAARLAALTAAMGATGGAVTADVVAGPAGTTSTI
ncbi:AfsR/SARP family transcriptional regulator [Occultella kanbiaonis]|uniref:AfsR/SARP family transcriptional regulator n=1 Tax=Occultella kanbiaonis TaxID=2675754 RepID=UPI00143D2079|nr:BTAD domain-containing putative transcriptional regulator [Occultella kanbiaonis]